MAGPYAHTRNPLYLGSFLLGLGATAAGGSWIFMALFVVFYSLVYRSTMRREEQRLEERFEERYRHYATSVPLLRPRLRPYRTQEGDSPFPGFSAARYLGNREYQALLGAVAVFSVLVAKMVLSG